MLITMKNKETLEKVSAKLKEKGLMPCVSCLGSETIIGLEKNLDTEMANALRDLPGVDRVIPTHTAYQMTSLAYKQEKTVVRVKGVEIGGKDVILMAGPCAIESKEQLLLIAKELKKAGVKVLRGSAYKPRTSPYSFQGLGVEGLKMHKEAQEEHGLLIETEVMEPQDVEIVTEYVDILRIGARNMQNYPLLKAVGKCGKPVILKRGMSATIEEWLLAAEYIMAHGNHDVILCERGIRTFENTTRSTLDLSSVAVVKTMSHLPVIVDPSHAAGRKDIIPDLSKAAVAGGADGLLIEVHHKPKESKCDANQALSTEEFAQIAQDLKNVAQAVGRGL
jgi:3-deoxy-7-phosphoheptulonate synthase